LENKIPLAVLIISHCQTFRPQNYK